MPTLGILLYFVVRQRHLALRLKGNVGRIDNIGG